MVFIDEIDALGFARQDKFVSGASRESDMTLNQLLTEMDGFNENRGKLPKSLSRFVGIIVIAATNQERQLDSALLRPGRFDRKVEVYLPNYDERMEILNVHLRSRKHDVSEDVVKRTATLTDGFSGADLEGNSAPTVPPGRGARTPARSRTPCTARWRTRR